MGRFLVIVLVIVGVGLGINYFASQEPASAEQQTLLAIERKVVDDGAGPALAPAGASAVEATPRAANEAEHTSVEPAVDSSDNPSGATAPATGSTGEASSTSEAAIATNEVDDRKSEPPAPDEIVASAEPAPPEEVLLGTDDLTTGIPGEGSLDVDEIREWLANVENHAVLKPTLPLGLAAASMQVTGIDETPLTRAKIELGRQLYFDPRLSGNHSISCASCHSPEIGYATNTQFGKGVDGQTGNRNSPVAYNRILSSAQFWDGRAPTLEEQAKGPIENPIEMSNTHEVCVAHLSEIEGYRIQFERIFPDGVNIGNVAKAIASFERTLVTGPSPWDYHEQLKVFEQVYGPDLEDLDLLKEDDPELYDEYMALKTAADEHPMDESAERGAELFFSDRVGCTACHVGANFTDELFHNLGVGMDFENPDLGRFEITGQDKDRGAFKTPTVRNVELTAPYMHDGSQATLEEVVEWYDKGGHPNPHLDEKIKPLELTDQEKSDLVAFMRALTGPLPKVEAGRLPE